MTNQRVDPNASEFALEGALAQLRPYGSSLANGLTSHAPMVVEALWRLGRIDAAEAWIDRYRPHLLAAGTAEPALDANDWRASLGHEALEGSWLALFTAEIEADGWQPVLSRWSERLAPGFAAAAAHGAIRTAHAARSLSRVDTPLRRAELAAGLALWASSWQALPGSPLERNGALSARDALRAIPLVPRARRRNEGAITTAITVLAEHPGFAPALGALDRARSADALVLDLARTFAQVFLDQVRTPLDAIVFTHAITGVAAAERLGRWAGEPAASSLLAHAWQTGAALYACYGDPEAVGRVVVTPTATDLVTAAVAHGDEHAIKLTEVCVDFHARSADPVFLGAAGRALEVVPPG